MGGPEFIWWFKHDVHGWPSRSACSSFLPHLPRSCAKAAPPGPPLARPQAGSAGGKRIFAFIIGGVTYSEMRAAHKLSARLGREIVLGGTSVETPSSFLRQVLELGAPSEYSALEIDTPKSFR